MKKLFTLLMGLVVMATVSAQSKLPNSKSNNQMATRMFTRPLTGLEDIFGHVGVPPHVSVIRNQEVEIGKTHYDLQANGSDNNRLTNLGGGVLIGTWTTAGATAAGGLNGPTRGTGMNVATAGSFLPSAPAGSRIETVRTGFGSHCVTTGGNIFNVAHRGVTATSYALAYTLLPAGSSTFVEGDIPSTSPNGQLWARAAAGGNNSIHVIALSTPSGFSGVPINGIDGVPFYYRSKDGGQTWDKSDFVIPGIDSLTFKRIGGESYHIDAQDNLVAVLIASSWGDVVAFKSEDYGDTWTKHVIYDFPIDGYLYDDGILDPGQVDTLDPNLPVTADGRDTLSVWSTDDNGSIHFDALGKMHIAYGAAYVRDDIPGDASYNWYPSTGGLVYWNEDLDDEDTTPKDGIIPGALIGFVLDFDGDGALGFTNAQYNGYAGSSMASKPSMGFNYNDGTIYVAFQSPVELYINADKDQAYSHVFIRASKDNGQTWSDFYDVANSSVTDPSIIEFMEQAFPFLAEDCSDGVHLIYQQDFTPGALISDEPAALVFPENSIMYVSLTDAEVTTAVKEPLKNSTVSALPNPASDNVNVVLKENSLVQIFAADGTLKFSQQLSAGANPLNVSAWQHGSYYILANNRFGSTSSKLIIMR